MEETGRNIALEIADSAIASDTDTEEGFVIDNDRKAEWALRKIQEERAEYQRYSQVCQAMILEYQEKMKHAEEQVKSRTSWLESQLHRYLLSVPRKVTKTQETYKLPGGTLRLRNPGPEFKRDDELLVKWLKENDMGQYIKVEEKAMWGELRKTLTTAGETVVTGDGQVVEGVTAVERPPVFEIETTT